MTSYHSAEPLGLSAKWHGPIERFSVASTVPFCRRCSAECADPPPAEPAPLQLSRCLAGPPATFSIEDRTGPVPFGIGAFLRRAVHFSIAAIKSGMAPIFRSLCQRLRVDL